MDTLTIKDIANSLKQIRDEKDPFIIQLEKDERKGVQKLLQQWRRQRNQSIEELQHFEQMMKYERDISSQGYQYIAGIDEVGRGPLAGPVVAAAVILPPDFILLGIDDSKKLSEKKRIAYYDYIQEHAIATGVGIISSEEIDQLNIYEATKKAMLSAINQLKTFPDYCLIDAMKLSLPIPQTSIIKGDASSVSIAAASIIAKVTRDRLMQNYSEQFPNYKFDSNMGYGTAEHLDALRTFGPCPIHRKTFAPVKNHF